MTAWYHAACGWIEGRDRVVPVAAPLVRARLGLAFGLLALGVLALGCDDAARECIPGQQQPCTCADGTSRFRLCRDDQRWNACLCYGSGADVTGAPDVVALDAGVVDSGPAAPDELCNGVDDDGDGAIDEWALGSNESCVATIPAGAFLMGCAAGTPGCQTDEQPAHEVSLAAFSMDRTEVTQAHWAACVAAGKCETPAHGFAPSDLPDHPVVMVNWSAAATFCAWRGGRLPTEAEWERAATGGVGRPWPWGNAPPTCERCNTKGCGDATSPVGGTGTLGASREGALGLAGNVREWVMDRYNSAGYPAYAGGATNPVFEDQDPQTERVVRGGSYALPVAAARTAARLAIDGKDEYEDIGFRCVYSDAKLITPGDSAPPAQPEVCNGVDDDLDGAVDEYTPKTNEQCVVAVAAGAFLMGCQTGDTACKPDEKPAHAVTLSAFSIDRTEVTEAHYAACVGAGACVAPASHFAPKTKADFPVGEVTWAMAQQCCVWRGGRLPTEAEWERVAGGGIGNLWPWGDTPPKCSHANLKGCGGGRTPVGAHGASGATASGVFDLAGNVAEWVFDHYNSDAYTLDKSGVLNPQHTSSKPAATRTARGGSVESMAAGVRSSRRMAMSAGAAYSDLGFRCVFPGK